MAALSADDLLPLHWRVLLGIIFRQGLEILLRHQSHDAGLVLRELNLIKGDRHLPLPYTEKAADADHGIDDLIIVEDEILDFADFLAGGIDERLTDHLLGPTLAQSPGDRLRSRGGAKLGLARAFIQADVGLLVLRADDRDVGLLLSGDDHLGLGSILLSLGRLELLEAVLCVLQRSLCCLSVVLVQRLIGLVQRLLHLIQFLLLILGRLLHRLLQRLLGILQRLLRLLGVVGLQRLRRLLKRLLHLLHRLPLRQRCGLPLLLVLRLLLGGLAALLLRHLCRGRPSGNRRASQNERQRGGDWCRLHCPCSFRSKQGCAQAVASPSIVTPRQRPRLTPRSRGGTVRTATTPRPFLQSEIESTPSRLQRLLHSGAVSRVDAYRLTWKPKKEHKMKKRFLILLASVALPLSVIACDADVEDEGDLPDVSVQTEGGEAPDVDVDPGSLPDVDTEVEGGRMPDVDVTGPDVDVGTQEETVTVPDVDVRTEEETITVPDVDVDVPEEEQQ